jgi:hypothetical protein
MQNVNSKTLKFKPILAEIKIISINFELLKTSLGWQKIFFYAPLNLFIHNNRQPIDPSRGKRLGRLHYRPIQMGAKIAQINS